MQLLVPARRHVGLLVVEVVEAKDLHKQDVFGKADPLVELWTQSTHKEQTVGKAATLLPLHGILAKS